MNNIDARTEMRKGHLRGKLIAGVAEIVGSISIRSLELVDELVEACGHAIRETEELAATAYAPDPPASYSSNIFPLPQPPSEE